MSYNYSGYVTDLANLLVVPQNDPGFMTALPNIIDDAEQRIYRELNLLSTSVRDSSANLTANSRNFVLPQTISVSRRTASCATTRNACYRGACGTPTAR